MARPGPLAVERISRRENSPIIRHPAFCRGRRSERKYWSNGSTISDQFQITSVGTFSRLGPLWSKPNQIVVARDSDPGHHFASVVLASLNEEGCGPNERSPNPTRRRAKTKTPPPRGPIWFRGGAGMPTLRWGRTGDRSRAHDFCQGFSSANSEGAGSKRPSIANGTSGPNRELRPCSSIAAAEPRSPVRSSSGPPVW